MDIKSIKDPSFLKEMDANQCQEIANEIRSFIIESVSKTGGHLSSNLGTVELTVALHKVFNSPVDKIFFDVGHQSYTHKILTGRANKFDKLRQFGGINGFEDRKESKHDVWEAGHSSTSLSGALGMAIARDLSHQNYHIVPVIGDGAMSSGMALEALNQIGDEKRNMVIVFNDNNMSISKNVGALTHGFSRLRASKSYNDLKNDVKGVLGKNIVGKTVLGGMRSVKNAFKESVVDNGIFGEFGLEYLGPVDGHNMKELIQAFDTAKDHDGPIVVHVITEKGHGYKYCENDKSGKWHGVTSFDIDTGEFKAIENEHTVPWSKLTCKIMMDLASTNDKIVCITPAMISGSKLEQFFAKYPERAFDCGIAEEHATTMAAGLAIAGYRPFLDIYSSFLQRSIDQVIHDICKMDLPVVIGIDRAGLVGEDGATHHGVFDISMLSMIPNIIVTQPKDACEASNLYYTAFKQQHPFAVRFPRGSTKKEGHHEYSLIPIGSWEKLNDADDNKVIVMTYGPDVGRVLGKVLVNNLPVTVINCRFFKPLDEKMLEEIAKSNKQVIIYETDILQGGLSSSVLEWLNDHNYSKHINRMGIKDKFVTFGATNLLKVEEKIDIDSLMKLIEEKL